LAIAQHLLSRRSPFEVALLTGSPVAGSWPVPEGLRIRQMPPVIKVGPEQYACRDGLMTFHEVKAAREAVILETINQFEPDAFLVDHAPAGMKGEILPALALLRQRLPATQIVLGLRDILDDGETVRSLWREQGTYDLLRAYYDCILVYGSRHMFDVVAEYGLTHDLSNKLRYCGYVARARRAETAAPTEDRPYILVTVGGGGDGYDPIHSYLEAIELVSPPWQTIIVSGPLMPAEQQRALETRVARRPDITLIPVTTKMSQLMRNAELVVAMAGYNTSVEILAAEKPAILVPRPAPRAEQRLRARMLTKIGAVWSVSATDNIGELARLLHVARLGARPPRLGNHLVDLNGAARAGTALEELLAEDTLVSAAAS
jgi:predicted glycosyltransferase